MYDFREEDWLSDMFVYKSREWEECWSDDNEAACYFMFREEVWLYK